MSLRQINPKNLRARCRAKQITVTELARRIGKSRQAVYFSVENPQRFSITYGLITAQLTS